MIVKSVEIKNIRSFEEEIIEFGEGITLFRGDIGSGKSSILMAIEFGLFGLGSQKPEALLKKRENFGSVLLKFEAGGKDYEVKRALKRTGAEEGRKVSQDAKETYLLDGGRLEPLAPSDLKRRILDILGFNEPAGPRAESRIFRYAVFTPQEEMKRVLSDPKGRLETVRKAFRMEDYKRALDNAGRLSQKMGMDAAELKGAFAELGAMRSDKAACEEDASKLEGRLAELRDAAGKSKEARGAAQADLDGLRGEADVRIRLQASREALEATIRDRKARMRSAEAEIARKKKRRAGIEEKIAAHVVPERPPDGWSLDRIDAEAKRLSRVSKQLGMERGRVGELSKRLEDFAGLSGRDLAGLRREKKEAEERLAAERDLLRGKEEEIARTRDEASGNRRDQKSASKDLAGLSELGPVCPTCGSRVSKDHIDGLRSEKRKRLEEFQQAMREINLTLEGLVAAKENIAAEVAGCESKLGLADEGLRRIVERGEAEARLAEARAAAAALEGQMAVEGAEAEGAGADPAAYLNRLRAALAEHDAAAAALEAMRASRDECEGDIQRLENEEREASEALAGGEDRLAEMDEKLAASSGIDEKVAAADTALREMDEKLARNAAEAAGCEEALSGKRQRLEELGSRIAAAGRAKRAHDRYDDYADWLSGFFEGAVSQIEKQVLLSTQQEFDGAYRKWYGMLIDDATKESRIDENFVPIIEQDGWQQEAAYLSGGEKTSVSLAYRLALSSTMGSDAGNGGPSELLILDEPTDGFSKAQLEKVRAILQQLGYRQIIMVSHEVELDAYADRVFRVSKEAGRSLVGPA